MLVVYESVIIVMILIEYNFFKSYFTPFSIMGCCYAVAPMLINTIGKNIGIYAIKDYNLWYTMVFLIIIWIPGLILSQGIKRSKLYNNNKIQCNCSRVDAYKLKLLVLFIVCILIFLVTVITVLKTYGFKGSKNHTDGIEAHFGYLALMIAPYIVYYAVSKKIYSYFIWVGILFFELVMLQNKLPIVILLLQSVYFTFMMQGRAKGKRIVKIGIVIILIVMLLFIGVYSIQPWLIDRSATMQQSLSYGMERFIHYFFSGFISSNEYYKNPAGNTFKDGWRVAFGFIDTLKEAIIGRGDYVNPVIEKWVLIAPGSATNVGGIFSELVYQIGFLGAGIYVFGIGIMVYVVFYLSCRYQIFVNTAAYLMAMTSVSFFCNFYALFSTFEKLIYVVILDLIVWKVRTKNIKIKVNEKALWEI